MKADGPLLMVDGLRVRHNARGGRVNAVNGVSFQLAHGQTLGLVGESGCGKSSLAKTIVGLNRALSGRIHFAGTDITPHGFSLLKRKNGDVARKLQLVCPDPLTSLNP